MSTSGARRSASIRSARAWGVHDPRRHRQRRTRQLCRLPQSRVQTSPVRILAFLNVSFAGIYGFSKRVMVGESGDLRLTAPTDAVEVARANPDTIVGNQGPRRPPCVAELRRDPARHRPPGGRGARSADDGAHRSPAADLEDVLARLRRTATSSPTVFAPSPTILDKGPGRVRQAVLEARERGVIFDVGHGMGSFGLKTAPAMLADGFLPNCISSDIHAFCIEGPAFDLVTTLSNSCGSAWTLGDVVRAATEAPAKALRRGESRQSQARRDRTRRRSLALEERRDLDYVNSTGEHVTGGDQRLTASGVVIGRRLVERLEPRQHAQPYSVKEGI